MIQKSLRSSWILETLNGYDVPGCSEKLRFSQNEVEPVLMRRFAWKLCSLVLPALSVLALAGSLKAEVWHLNAAASVGGTGTSWQDAFQDLQDALAVAQSGDEIWVAKGVYKPDRGTGDRSATFQLVNGVGLYGGFAGWETKREQRDWVNNETILSGDLIGDDGPPDCEQYSDCCGGRDALGCDDAECEQIVCGMNPFCCEPYFWQDPVWSEGCAEVARRNCCHLGNWRTCDNTYRIVTATGVSSDTVLDGFTVERAYAAFERDLVSGAGLRCSAANPIVANCVFRKNAVFGILSRDASELTLTDCLVIDTEGIGLRYLDSDPSLINCSFVRNTGAGMYGEGDPTLTNCVFRGNSFLGGLISFRGNPTLTNCSFVNNTGGGMRHSSGTAVLRNCTFMGNSDTRGHGAGMLSSGAIAILSNCAFIGNEAFRGGALVSDFSRVTLTNCLITGNFGIRESGAMLIVESHLKLINCTMANNVAGFHSGGIRLEYGGAEVENCIFWGNRDLTSPTVQTAQIDLGMEATATVNFSCVEGWDGTLGGVGNFSADPLFVPGPAGDYYLSQTAAGQGVESPVVNAGSDTAVNLGLDTMTTRSDEGLDTGIVDIGYHFPITGRKLILGDFDRNGLIDLFDVSGIQNCFTGQGPTDVPPSCRIFDFDARDDITLFDLAVLIDILTGP